MYFDPYLDALTIADGKASLAIALAVPFLLGLAACVFTDLKARIIPNRVTYPLIVGGAAVAPWLWANPGSHLISGAVCAVFFGAIAMIKVRAGYVMGMGDAKLYTAVALVLGPAVVLAVVAANLVGIAHGVVTMTRQGTKLGATKVAHGPHIVAGTLIVLAAAVIA